MKNLKKFSKVLALVLIITLFIALTSSVFASGSVPTNSLERIRVKVTNLQEPAIGEEPDFYYNVRTYNQYGYNFDMFEIIEWREIDLSLEDTLDLYESVSLNTNPTDEDIDYYEEIMENSRVVYNEDSDFVYYEIMPSEAEESFDTFIPDRTYVVTFFGIPSCGYYGKPDSITSFSVESESTLGKKVIKRNLDTNNTKLKVIPNSNYNYDLTVNGKSSNVKGYYFDYENYFVMHAFYRLDLPKQDYKATVNWIDAEGKIPDSFVLKLMNGSTVVKEQVITKDNAVDDDTWEYDFGEYPTIDDNGNEITYTLAYSESKDGDLKLFESNQDGFVINNKYIAPIISSKIKMRSIADREANNVKYRIDYSASIKKYSGNADVLLTATLPFAIDEQKSDLDDGTYDPKTKTITWTSKIEDIDKMYDYSTTKNIDVYATAVLPYAIEAKAVGEISLSDAEGYSESVDAIDNIEAGTGNPKTGDINLQKYLSFGLIGLAAILMVVSIKRKYSTKKKNVQF